MIFLEVEFWSNCHNFQNFYFLDLIFHLFIALIFRISSSFLLFVGIFGSTTILGFYCPFGIFLLLIFHSWFFNKYWYFKGWFHLFGCYFIGISGLDLLLHFSVSRVISASNRHYFLLYLIDDYFKRLFVGVNPRVI